MIFTPSDPIGALMCANITIILDSVVENTESFQIVLDSSDPSIVLTQSTATVNISDSSGKYCIKIMAPLDVHVATLYINYTCPNS